MKSAGWWVISLAAAAAASLLLARTHPFGNAHLYDSSIGAPPLASAKNVPEPVRATLIAKCADCHSMQVHVPFYGRLAPASWLLEHDILEGRKAMNLSAWGDSSPEQQQTLKAKIVAQMKNGEMPPWEYTLIHRRARITAADLASVIEWARQPVATHDAHPEQPLREGDAAHGKLLFTKQCTGCHAMRRNREGPKLEGIYGERSATVTGFVYSDALKKAHLTWDDATLDRWLADSDALAPGNNMEFPVADAQQRRDLIRYLRESSGK